MQTFSFPLWAVKYVLPGRPCKTSRKVLEDLVDSFCGIANSGNLGGIRTDRDIANAIGALSLKHPNAADDLADLFTRENCRAGMDAYVHEFEDGLLVRLAEEIGDGGQYINALQDKFDAAAAK